MKEYFKLFPECYLVNGKKSSVIYDLFTGNVIALNEAESKEILRAENNQKVESSDFLSELEKMGVGKYLDAPLYVAKYREWSLVDQFTAWKRPPVTRLAQIQVTNQCNLNCSFCKDRWCPNCIRLESTGKDVELATWLDIIDQLEALKCQNLIITGGEATLYPHMDELLGRVKSMAVSVVTNGLTFEEYLREVNVILNIFPQTAKAPYIQKIMKNVAKINKPQLNAVGLRKEELDNIVKLTNWKDMTVSPINYVTQGKGTMLKTFATDFFIKSFYDPGLYGRVTITLNGDIIPCFMSRTPIGNVHGVKLYEVMDVLIDNYWKHSKDKIERCKDCQFRFSCPVCMPALALQKIPCDIS
jgi:radical SAM protein with 4Fe4S-binding SPASM domain